MIDSIEEKRRFATLMTGIADYYRKELSKVVMALYWEGLRQYDYEAVEKVMRAHTQTPDEAGRWMPMISDLTKMMQGRTQDQAQLAWSKVDKAVRQIGNWRDVAFDDSAIHRVITDMGGWIALGVKKEDEWPFVAKEFETRYRGYRMRGESPDYPSVLIGMANAANGSEGRACEAPTLIGDQAKAAAVMAGGSSRPMIEMRQAGQIAAPVLRVAGGAA